MFSRHQILYSLVLCLLMQKVLSQESPDFAEEYIDEDLPETSVDEETAAAGKAVANETTDSNQKKTQHFSDDRFTKLFQPRHRPGHGPNQPNKPLPFLPKFAHKAKPTLPSFIKRTPPIIKANPSTPSPAQSGRFNQRTTSTTSRPTTTRTPSRGNNNLSNRRNQNNNNRFDASTTARPTQSTTDSSSRRRYGGLNRRFNVNSTIPATTSRPRRF